MPPFDLTSLALKLRWMKRRMERGGAPLALAADSAILIGNDETGRPVFYPPLSRTAASHGLVCASSGSGKSVILAQVIVRRIFWEHRHLPPERRTAVCVIDGKGDLARLIILGLAAECPEILGQTHFISPFDYGAPLNWTQAQLSVPEDIFAAGVANIVDIASTSTASMGHLRMGSKQRDAVTELVLAVQCIREDLREKANVLLALDAIQMRKGLAKLAAITTNSRSRSFLKNTYMTDEFKSAVGARLRGAFAATSSVERLVSCPGCISIPKLLSAGQIALVDLGNPPGNLASLRNVWACLLAGEVFGHVMSRPSPWPVDNHLAAIYCDEAQILAPVLEQWAEDALCRGRSKGVALSLCTQATSLLDKAGSGTLLKTLVANTTVRIIGRLEPTDALAISKTITPGPGVDESPSTVRARFQSVVTNLQDRSFIMQRPGERQRFRSIDVDLDQWERKADEIAPILDRVHQRYAVPNTGQPRVTLADMQVPRRQHQKSSRRKQGEKSKWG